MPHNNLLDFLTDIITEQLHQQAQPPVQPKPGVRNPGLHSIRSGRQPCLGAYPNIGSHGLTLPTPPIPAHATLAHKIAANLLEQALKSNLSFDLTQTSEIQLKGGNTAGAVTHITLHLPFVFKFEVNDDTVKKEALVMHKIKNNSKLSQDFRNAWATVYAIYEDGPPYAYLMEFFPAQDGWQSLENRLNTIPRPSNACTIEWINAAVNLMFSGYESSVAVRSRPNLLADYGSRLTPRLIDAEKLGLPKGNFFASRPLCINGTLYKPWREYLALLERHPDCLNQITPTFSTVVHGDPNPGNFMLKLDSGKVTVKLIDPKDWEHGDYLLDIAKLSHFLQIVCPTEYAADGIHPVVSRREIGNELVLDYSLQANSGINIALEGCMEKVRRFAKQHNDTGWEARYELAMAANLLGLPVGRLKKDRLDAALIFLAEGIIWLDRFCERLEAGFRQGKCVYYAPPDTFEPDSFQQERVWLQQRIPDAILVQSGRGYANWQWYTAPNAETTSMCASSFEHQAHFCCGPSMENSTFLNTLANSARTMQPFLPDSHYRSWHITRATQYPPTTRRCYDYTNSGGMLIQRQISLYESLSANANLPAWELELPYVALGSSGVRAGLAYHWHGSWQATRADCQGPHGSATSLRHPLALAAERHEIEPNKLVPIMQQTIYRESFLVKNAIDQAKFAIHINHVVAQDLASGRIGSHVEIQIEIVAPMDKEELPLFTNFVSELVRQYKLVVNPRTLAQRGADAVGMDLNG